jgi:two-component system response regulator ResD
MAGLRVLVVDDEPMVREILERYLVREGFAVTTAEDGEEALIRFADARPHLVLLDLMLPRIDGLEVFRRMRASAAQTPVIMLTARGEETDRVVGLELGADDYVTKPFSPREVVARVRAVLRRTDNGVDHDGILTFGDLRMDRGRREVRMGDRDVHLTRKEFDLLEHLASSPGITFTRTALLESVWDFAWEGDTATVTVHIRRLREKLEVDPSSPRHLITVWGVGYRFEP